MSSISSNTVPGGRIAVGSDFHLRHDRDFIWKPRGFSSCEEHTRRVLCELAQLGPDDLLLFLGDFSLNSSPEDSAHLLRSIPARVLYIWGNHESWVRRVYEGALRSQGMPDDQEVHPLVWEHVHFLGHQAYLSLNGRKVFVSHYAHRTWLERENGAWHLCGHTHGNDRESLPEFRPEKRLDVGVEVALASVGRTFFFLDEIERIMDRKHVGTHTGLREQPKR